MGDCFERRRLGRERADCDEKIKEDDSLDFYFLGLASFDLVCRGEGGPTLEDVWVRRAFDDDDADADGADEVGKPCISRASGMSTLSTVIFYC